MGRGWGWCLWRDGCFKWSGHVRIGMELASLSTYARLCKGLGNEFTNDEASEPNSVSLSKTKHRAQQWQRQPPGQATGRAS